MVPHAIFRLFPEKEGGEKAERGLRLLFVCKITKKIGIVIITPPLKFVKDK